MTATLDAIEPLLEAAILPTRDDARDLWTSVAFTLDTLNENLSKSARQPSSVSDKDRLAAAELIEPCRELRALLFDEPVQVVMLGESERSSRWLIQFVEPDQARELVASLSELDPVEYAGQARYLYQWLSELARGLNPADPLRSFLDRTLLVESPGDTAKNRVAFDHWRGRIRSLARIFEVAADVTSNAAVLVDTADEVKRLAEDVKKNTGGIANDELASHFTKVAEVERSSAQRWTQLTVVCLVAVTTIAAASLIVDPADDWKIRALHLFLTLPAAILAAYSSRVASRHRQQYWWAQSTAAQLHTVTLYVAPLDADSRSRLLAQVGQRVFAQPAVNTSAQEPDAASLTASITDAFSKLLDKKGEL